jgi:hypothetical protein
MKNRHILEFTVLLSMTAALLEGCKLKVEPTPIPPTDTPAPTATVTLTPVPPTPTGTPVPTLTPTPDTRQKPEDWQDWPIVPTLSPRALAIYRKGIAAGNDPKAFSKVGDCQSIKEAFMGLFDLKDRFVLTEDHKIFQETIDNFHGHFNTDSQAVKGGFNAAAVLSPMWANPDVCLPGENPLECEIRVTKPTFMFIRLEVWWDGRTAKQYEAYMRKIIEYAIAHGVVPILATKADNLEGDNSLNETTAKLAYEYDIPLWNFWRAVQPLPNHGLDANRPDGFHISYDAWNVASFGGLEVLDTLWRAARGK